MQTPYAFLNGKFLPAKQVAIPLTDAGFVLGATLAEQLRTFHGRIYRTDEHLARLWRSLELLHVAPRLTRAEVAAAAEELVARNHRLLHAEDDLGVSIVITPGAYPGYGGSAASEPLVCLHTYPLQFQFWAEKYRVGQRLRTTSVEQVPERCWPRGMKCRSRVHYYLADHQAAELEPGARAVLLDEHGRVTEASTANILLYRADMGLAAPPRGAVLPGISLATVVELAAELGIPYAERELLPDDLATADEVLLSSTPLCLLPATSLNGKLIGPGKPGAVFQRLIQAWSKRVGLGIVGQAERFAPQRTTASAEFVTEKA